VPLLRGVPLIHTVWYTEIMRTYGHGQCLRCGVPFIAKRMNQQYCARSCSNNRPRQQSGPTPRSVADRFSARIDECGPVPPHQPHLGPCWVWLGYKNPKGYGQINLGRPRKLRLVHCLSWELAYGPLPVGLCVLHHCDTPACVRPDHLFLGTRVDNNADMRAKGRASKPPNRWAV